MHPGEPLQDSTFKIRANRMSMLKSEPMCHDQLSVFKSFAISPCAEGGMNQQPQLRPEGGQQAAPQQIADLMMVSAGFSFISLIPGTSLLQQLVLIQVLSPSAQVQCTGISCETDMTYRRSGSYLSNTPLPNILKGC